MRLNAYRTQAHALAIESAAKQRLADEYDAAQERGEVSVQGQHGAHAPNGNMRGTAADLGLSRKDIFEARMVRDAEKEDPGIVKRTQARFKAERAFAQLTRPPLIVQRRRRKPLPLPPERKGRVPAPKPDLNDDDTFCSWCADSEAGADPFHPYCYARKS